jgi:outer membrane protein assembly factor BamD
MKHCQIALMISLLAACGGKNADVTPTPRSGQLSEAALDSLWANTEQLRQREKWSEAAVLYERLLLEMPRGNPRAARARLGLAEMRLKDRSTLQAVREFRRVADDHPTDSLAPVGLLKAGEAYASLWRRPELDPTYGFQAMATYQEVLTRFPASPAATEARAGMARLTDMFARKQFKAAEFYLKYKAWDSAILYLKDLVTQYPATTVAPEALERLVGVYRELGYVEEVAETCDYFRRIQPNAGNLTTVCPATPQPEPAPGA